MQPSHYNIKIELLLLQNLHFQRTPKNQSTNLYSADACGILEYHRAGVPGFSTNSFKRLASFNHSWHLNLCYVKAKFSYEKRISIKIIKYFAENCSFRVKFVRPKIES